MQAALLALQRKMSRSRSQPAQSSGGKRAVPVVRKQGARLFDHPDAYPART